MNELISNVQIGSMVVLLGAVGELSSMYVLIVFYVNILLLRIVKTRA